MTHYMRSEEYLPNMGVKRLWWLGRLGKRGEVNRILVRSGWKWMVQSVNMILVRNGWTRIVQSTGYEMVGNV